MKESTIKIIVFMLYILLLTLIVGYPIKKACASDFYGLPEIRVTETFNEQSERIVLNDTDTLKFACIISNSPHLWKSRGGVPLTFHISGIFLVFTADTGAGYIKINTITNKYIEHMHLGLVTITYHGEWKGEKQIK